MGRFGKFELVQQIGGGRLSQVFRVGRAGQAELPAVALKRVMPPLITEEAFVQLVVREAALLTRLDHPNLCACHEMGVVDGCAFLTLDLVQGCTLRALLRYLSRIDQPLPSSAVLVIGHQLASVLDYLHRQCSQPLIHLDLSPQNVMIDRQGQVKLIDFGIARYLDGHAPPPLSGQLAGTVGYMSPAQARGEEQFDLRADQYTLGILLWEMTRGRRLFPGNSAQTWRRMRIGQVPELSAPDHPEELLVIISRMLAADPADRYRHLGEVARELAGLRPQGRRAARPLAALIQRLLADPAFDPFDAVNLRATTPEPDGIPTGDRATDEYAAIEIAVDQGEGTPAAQIRAAVPEGEGEALPSSPFLEMLPDPHSAGEL